MRDEEIQFFEQQLQQLTNALQSSNLRLDAVRVIVATSVLVNTVGNQEES